MESRLVIMTPDRENHVTYWACVFVCVRDWRTLLSGGLIVLCIEREVPPACAARNWLLKDSHSAVMTKNVLVQSEKKVSNMPKMVNAPEGLDQVILRKVNKERASDLSTRFGGGDRFSRNFSQNIFWRKSAISHSAENSDENQSNNLAEDISAENVNRTNET